jgi:predicted MFS family arabinose efflux permease
MTEAGSFNASSKIVVLLIVPFINFLGILAVREVYKHFGYNSTKTLFAVFSLSSLFALAAVVFAGRLPSLCLVSTVLLLTQVSGLTPLMTSIIPFKYVSYGKVSFVAGGTDFLIYCGAALSSLAASTIADSSGWRPVMFIWLTFAILGTAAAFAWRLFDRKRRKSE